MVFCAPLMSTTEELGSFLLPGRPEDCCRPGEAAGGDMNLAGVAATCSASDRKG